MKSTTRKALQPDEWKAIPFQCLRSNIGITRYNSGYEKVLKIGCPLRLMAAFMSFETKIWERYDFNLKKLNKVAIR